MPERLSPLQVIALICTKLDQGASEGKIRDWLTVEDDLFSFCIEFAVGNDNVVLQFRNEASTDLNPDPEGVSIMVYHP